ncbi:NADP-dependent isocitrate dehydrogenase [Blattabacterium cuenoti]|uniref:NADP-dependent isocitrate dehydrogenase n=1 Tax=Blattabacterium cuenoti TaxID=1653831 RepID=UPI00163C3F9B|nr:NADP-dependent isocitrate dehydrogenase [Blattabacterium cuenoti]
MKKISVNHPIVELDGDEMARVIWKYIKDYFIYPYLDIKIIYFDLSIKNRDFTNDTITIDAANAIKKYHVGIKCATITPDQERMKEFNLKQMWKSPNGTIRNIIDGTIFREPIITKNIHSVIPNWKHPICIARHAYADQYQSIEFRVKEKGKLYLSFVPDDNNKISQQFEIFHFDNPGVSLGMYNTDKSIHQFARSCFLYSIKKKYPLFLSTKNTILKSYDGRYKDIFNTVYQQEFLYSFKKLHLTYEHRLIDDMIAYVIRSKGGFVWACKNYDGDVQSDAIAQGFGSLGMMTSVLLNGNILEAEAAHGTITRHYKLYKKGQKTSTNPIASIFSWTNGLKHIAMLDNNKKLKIFSEKIEESCIEVIESGKMTKDLFKLAYNDNKLNNNHQPKINNHYLDTETFLNVIKSHLEQKLDLF